MALKPVRDTGAKSTPTRTKHPANESGDLDERRLRPTVSLVPTSLEVVESLSYGSLQSGNAIIQGENLRVLRSLKETLAQKVRCVYLDPPYNNQEKYRHYRDISSHEKWLEDVVERLYALRPLLSIDGSVWISIDDREVHYLKVAADQVLGRQNFISTIVWQQRTTRENRKVFSSNHEYILVYAKSSPDFRKHRNPLPAGEELLRRYRNPDNDARGPWQSVSANVQDGHATDSQFYEIVAPNGRRHIPPKGRCWIYTESKMLAEIRKGNVWFGKSGNGVPRLKRFLSSSQIGLTPHTLWTSNEVGTNDDAKKHLLQLLPDEPTFDTPKPEALIARIIGVATNPGDIVLDAYLGSGTTAAVAHKMGRSYLGIEHGDQAVTHCASRLRRVVDGEAGGISPTVGWKGGGGFEFYQAND